MANYVNNYWSSARLVGSTWLKYSSLDLNIWDHSVAQGCRGFLDKLDEVKIQASSQKISFLGQVENPKMISQISSNTYTWLITLHVYARRDSQGSNCLEIPVPPVNIMVLLSQQCSSGNHFNYSPNTPSPNQTRGKFG